MRDGNDILVAAGLPAELGDLWAAEALVESNGVTTYHVGRLAEILNMNDVQVGRGTSSNYVPFALCRTAEDAMDAVQRMKKKQAALAALRDDPYCQCDICRVDRERDLECSLMGCPGDIDGDF